MTTRPAGPPAYLAAHRIAAVDGRLPFEQAYSLSRLVIEHGGGPLVPEREGTMSLKVFKLLAAEDLVLITSELSERLRPAVELTISSMFVQELGMTPPVGVRVIGFTQARRKIDRYVEVTEQGAEMITAAIRAAKQHHAG